jgi:hypothetical protein
MIYTKIPDSVKINYMDRWNEPANQKVIGKTKAKAVKK